jgi:nicotinate-nucleotide adenylyltransferase
LDNIGLYGGTFNPIHFGHLRTAWEVKEALDLTSVVFIPAAIPPHKKSGPIETAHDRMEMIRLAMENRRGFEVSDVELQRSGLSFTIDTVKYFQTKGAGETKFYFIIGSDAFLEINTWKSYEELFTLISFIVMVRPDPALKAGEGPFPALHDFLCTKISKRFVFQPGQECYHHPELMPVYVQKVTPLGISSTKIREMIREGRSARFLIPDAVENYIHTKGLYT